MECKLKRAKPFLLHASFGYEKTFLQDNKVKQNVKRWVLKILFCNKHMSWVHSLQCCHNNLQLWFHRENPKVIGDKKNGEVLVTKGSQSSHGFEWQVLLQRPTQTVQLRRVDKSGHKKTVARALPPSTAINGRLWLIVFQIQCSQVSKGTVSEGENVQTWHSRSTNLKKTKWDIFAPCGTKHSPNLPERAFESLNNRQSRWEQTYCTLGFVSCTSTQIQSKQVVQIDQRKPNLVACWHQFRFALLKSVAQSQRTFQRAKKSFTLGATIPNNFPRIFKVENARCNSQHQSKAGWLWKDQSQMCVPKYFFEVSAMSWKTSVLLPTALPVFEDRLPGRFILVLWLQLLKHCDVRLIVQSQLISSSFCVPNRHWQVENHDPTILAYPLDVFTTKWCEQKRRKHSKRLTKAKKYT